MQGGMLEGFELITSAVDRETGQQGSGRIHEPPVPCWKSYCTENVRKARHGHIAYTGLSVATLLSASERSIAAARDLLPYY